MSELKAAIVSIGNELTSGQTVDTNSAWIAKQLASIGIEVLRHNTVDDHSGRMLEVFRQSLSVCDVLIISGGLGPTADDLTRHVLADLLGCQLELREDCLEYISNFFAKRGWQMNESNRVQAMCPALAEPVENPVGTAPGVRAEAEGKLIYATPGVPFELKRMMADHILPELESLSGGRATVFTKVNCFGLGESTIGEKIADLMARDTNPLVGTTAAGGIVGVRIIASGEDRNQASTLAEVTASEVAKRLGSCVFGRDEETLAEVIGQLLTRSGKTLAVAESCTGGLVGKMLTDMPGSSEFFLGGVVSYANRIKRDILGVSQEDLDGFGAVSEKVAASMAEGVRKLFKSDYALSLTGIAGPDGGTDEKPVGLVYIALATEESTVVNHRVYGSTRDFVRTRAAFGSLDLLRLELQENE